MIAPPEDEHLFVCRKGYHAINVQGVMGPDGRFFDIVAKWLGSKHDSFIWTNVRETNYRRLVSGGQRIWTGSVVTHPSSKPYQQRRRGVQQVTSVNAFSIVVERGFGMWKLRFRCLHKSGGCLMFSTERCLGVIVATSILHNICIERNTPLPVDDDDEDDAPEVDNDYEGEPDDHCLGNEVRAAGMRIRNDVITGHFAN